MNIFVLIKVWFFFYFCINIIVIEFWKFRLKHFNTETYIACYTSIVN